ncbi:MAG: hypothetical protein ABI528_08575 [bacterium]
MKKKILILASLVVILAAGVLYTQSNLIADDKDGKTSKDCKTSCTQKSSTEKSGCTDKNMSGANTSDDKDGYKMYEFVTDKIHCDACKSGMSENLMGISGVKEVNYGETCNVSKMTSIKVYFSETETTPEVIAASVKEKGLQGNCSDGTKCDSKKSTEKKL